MTSKSVSVKTLTFNLNDPLFQAYGRRRYEQDYTVIPAKAYSINLAELIAAFESTFNFEPEDTLTVVAADGYAQRVAGPKIYTDGGALVVKYGKQSATLTYDSGDLSINGQPITVILEGENPVAVISIGKGLKALVPFRTAKSEEKISGKEIVANIENGDFSNIQAVGVGSINFTALKELSLSRYKVIKSELISTGLYGPKTKLTLELIEPEELVCTVSAEGKWVRETLALEAGAKIVIDANQSLHRSLQGLVLSAKDNVVLEVTRKEVDEAAGKTYVTAGFDFSASHLCFDF